MSDKPKKSETKPQPFTSAEWADADLAARNYINEEIMSDKPNSEYERLKKEAGYDSFSLSDKCRYIMEIKHYDMDSGAEAHLDFFKKAVPDLCDAYDALKQENEELRRELQGIISKCEWYATVHQGPDHEAHHALKVEIPEEARAALKNGGGE